LQTSQPFTRNTLDGHIIAFKLSSENTSNVHITKTNMIDIGDFYKDEHD